MKGKRFHERVGFAVAGLCAAWRHEASFQAHVGAAAGLAIGPAVVQPPAMGVAVALLTAAAVLALEAVNAAIEALADAVHPHQHPGAGRAKDVAAAAVLIAGIAAVGVGYAWYRTPYARAIDHRPGRSC